MTGSAQTPTTPNLTPEGQRLADALVKADHEFKAHPTVFHPARRGDKTFEFRKDDRGGYHVGQTVCLRCYTPETGYTDDAPLYRIITDILRPGEFDLQDGYCILSLRPLTAPDGEGAGLREALKPFTVSADSLTKFPPAGLVNGNLYVACKNEGEGTGWRYVAIHALVSDLHRASVALTKQPAAQEPAAAGVVGGPQIAQALRAADWSDVSIGNKALISAAIATLTPAAPKTPDADTGGEDEPEADLPRIDRIERQMLQHGGVDSGDMEWMAAMTRTAIKPAATGGSVGDGGLREALVKAERALKPFANRVYNDNGDISVSDTYRCGLDEFTAAYFAHRTCVSALAQSAPVGEDETGVREHTRKAVARAMDEDGGWWKSCSGCHETNEGYETGYYPFSELFRCHVGAGCSECGGLGVVWEYYSDEDFAAMAAESLAPQPPKAETPAGVEALRDALDLILPMAMGYAAAHPVGANARKIEHAEAVLAAANGGQS